MKGTVHRMLLRKYIGESWLLWVALALALFAFAWVRVWLTGLFEFGEVRDILDRFKRFERFSPIPFDQLSSYEGRVGICYDEPLVLTCVLIWSVARGSDVVSGELGRGTLEMLLGAPISRLRLLSTHAAVCVLGLIGLVFIHWAGMWCGIQSTSVLEKPSPVVIEVPLVGWTIPLTSSDEAAIEVPLRERVDSRIYFPAALNLFAFGFLLFGMATGFSCVDRFRWRTVGLTIAVHVVQVVFYGLSRASDRLEAFKYWTYCSCYRPQEMTMQVTREGFVGASLRLFRPTGGVEPDLFCLTVLMLLLGTSLWLLGLALFRRRDLPAPL